MSAHNTVKFTLDPAQPLTHQQRERLKKIEAMPDSEIDYSDIPQQIKAVQWIRPGALIPAENKKQITLRLDMDVLSFFKDTGKRYQSRINAVLREYMYSHR